MKAEICRKRSTVWLVPSLGGGGAERTVITLTGELQAKQIDCTIGILQPVVDYQTNVPVERVVPFGVLRPELWSFLGRPALRRIEARRTADATVSFTTSANLLNAGACNSDYPRYISIRNTMSHWLRGPGGAVRRHLMRRYYPAATKVIAISKFVADDSIAHFGLDPKRVCTIYNPVPIESVRRLSTQPLPAPWDSELSNRFSIVTAGRLCPEKGHAHLLRVLAELRRRRIDSRLLVAGKGPRFDDYAALARDLGLSFARSSDSIERQRQADVVFLGFVQNPFPLMRQADVFAFPSAVEGLGQALLEALATGATIVASDCDSGPREILAPGTDYRYRTRVVEETACGWLAPAPSMDWRTSDSGSVQQWASVIEHVHKHSANKGRECRHRVKDFGAEAIAGEWIQLLGW